MDNDYKNLKKITNDNENLKSYLKELYGKNKPYIAGGILTLSGFGLSFMLEGTINPIKLLSLTEYRFHAFNAYIYTIINQVEGYDYLKYEGLKFAGDLISNLMIYGGPPTTFIIKEEMKEKRTEG